jgi:hypothetical protein
MPGHAVAKGLQLNHTRSMSLSDLELKYDENIPKMTLTF